MLVYKLYHIMVVPKQDRLIVCLVVAARDQDMHLRVSVIMDRHLFVHMCSRSRSTFVVALKQHALDS